jgi:hypothetical protein
VALRPARLLPPKRLSTPRSARRLSATNRGLLPGAPAITRTGLSPVGMVQFPGRNTSLLYHNTSYKCAVPARLGTAGKAGDDRVNCEPDLSWLHGRGHTAWMSGTSLRIRRLGIRVCPSALIHIPAKPERFCVAAGANEKGWVAVLAAGSHVR